MEMACADAKASGPVEEYILTPDEFYEFTLDHVPAIRPGLVLLSLNT